MRSRAFGVEIECGLDCNGVTKKVTRKRAETDEWGYSYYDEDAQAAIDVLEYGIKVGLVSKEWRDLLEWDGTLVEYRSPILRGPSGFAELQRMMNLLRENGGYVTSEDGMHVHHDAPEFISDVELQKKLVRSWVDNFNYVTKFVNPDRVDGYPCPAWEDDDVARLELTGEVPLRRSWDETRRDLNIRALSKHGTIELRLHEGTLDFDEAEAWIRFGQAFINKIAAGKKVVPDTREADELLRKIRVPARVRPTLLKRAGIQVAA